MKKVFCLAPWYGLYIGDTFVRPCCLWSALGIDVPGWKTIDDIEKMWYGEEMQITRKKFLNGTAPPNCVYCLRRIIPRNIWLDEKIGEYVDKDKIVPNPPLKPLHVDFHLGNKCNLQCRMCASWASHNWIKDDTELIKLDEKFDRRSSPKKYEFNTSKFKDFKEIFSNVVRFDFKGGEPMLHDGMVKMVHHLIEWGNSQNMSLSYITNTSVINKEVMALWKYFKEVRLVVSIDGTDELFSYIRGFDFKKLEKNIRIYDRTENVKGCFNVAVSIYNILDIGKINTWMRDSELMRFPSIKSKHIYIFNCNVLNPSYLDVTILPKRYKQLALRKVQKYKHSNLECFIEWLKSIQDIPPNEEQLRLFVSFTKEMDKRLGTNFLDIKPEFEDLFKEYS